MLRLCLLAFFLLTTPAFARAGDLDKTFGSGGRLAVVGGTIESRANAAEIDASGHAVVAGDTSGFPDAPDGVSGGNMLVRLTNAGRVDGAIASPLVAGDEVRHALLPDGGEYVASATFGSGWQTLVVRLRADGSVDPGFASLRLAGEVRALAADGQSRLLIGMQDGRASSVRRALPNGTVDTAYGDGGTVPLPTPNPPTALLVTAGGSAWVATASAPTVYRNGEAVIYSFDPHGRARAGWPARILLRSRVGQAGAPGVTALVRGPDSTVLVAGTDQSKERTYGWVVRVTARARLDKRFHQLRFTGPHSTTLLAMARDHHGRIVLAGARDSTFGFQSAVLRLRADGRPDTHFGTKGVVVKQLGALAGVRLAASMGRAVAIDRKDRITVAGSAYDDNALEREDFGRGYFAVTRLKG